MNVAQFFYQSLLERAGSQVLGLKGLELAHRMHLGVTQNAIHTRLCAGFLDGRYLRAGSQVCWLSLRAELVDVRRILSEGT